ncbi:stage III sporulation protein AA [Gracilibacillus caseinilyticus]|uniref:Stage III sporulation protein AA n=1 Tax=Gracilibacillus caseinilyticus TaxID=2932256 RepID=A0ABY4ETS9_9BACI|nr:stage III sporulation protein AA [Gracilibacillus caseinilyticus]UOQ47476.1 stage III sporulation protein AA [Gracilibacillus caseinilyticus]
MFIEKAYGKEEYVMESVLQILPNHITDHIHAVLEDKDFDVQEIRLRVNQPVELNNGRDVRWLQQTHFSQSDATLFLNKISDFSLYRLEEELRHGFITIQGGHRIGISGSVVVENRQVKAIHHISSFNIRIAKPQFGVIHAYTPYLITDTIQNTLIIGPPQSGKTTLLRDIANYCGSSKLQLKTAIVDERSEICASINGVPQHLFAPRIDVLDRCPKAEGMMMFVRSMSPEVVIVDEIGSERDAEAIDEVIHAGVQIVCTVHGKSLEDIMKRPTMKNILEKNIFQRFMILSNQQRAGEVTEILDASGQSLYKSRVKVW